ncbi:hypothetical protein [Saccharopolyspora hattusasensis]|uniref:hypothetical protein n=1 Tax=Saccharopolyspora hattusasensis TaxID=1128679 RepID=UPI003D98F306
MKLSAALLKAIQHTTDVLGVGEVDDAGGEDVDADGQVVRLIDVGVDEHVA